MPKLVPGLRPMAWATMICTTRLLAPLPDLLERKTKLSGLQTPAKVVHSANCSSNKNRIFRWAMDRVADLVDQADRAEPVDQAEMVDHLLALAHRTEEGKGHLF